MSCHRSDALLVSFGSGASTVYSAVGFTSPVHFCASGFSGVGEKKQVESSIETNRVIFLSAKRVVDS